MKKLRISAGISIFLILVFMVAALFHPRKEETVSFLPDQFEYYYNEDWKLVSLNGIKEAGLSPDDHDGIVKLTEDALAAGEYQEVTLPYEGKSRAEDVMVFINTLPGEYAGLTLGFFSPGASVRVALDGEVIYEHEPEYDEMSGKASENDENFVDIPHVFGNGELWIELTSPYPDAAAALGSVKIETRDMVVIGVVGNSIAEIGCCLLIVLMSIVLFMLALIRRRTRQPARGELFLGLAGLASGLYCFIATDTLSIFYNIQEAYEMQEYLVLLLPLLLTLYFDQNLHTTYPRRFSVLLWGMILNAVVQLLLHTLGIRNLADMVNISAAAVAAVCVTAIVSLIQLDYRNRRYQTLPSVLSLCILLAGGILNVINNRLIGYIGDNTAGQYSMALFSVIMAVMHTLQISMEYRAAAEESASLLAEKVRAAKRQNMQLFQAKKDADAARHEALAANEAKGKFLARMSHEIRTPINAVLGMDEMILRESGEPHIKEYAMDIYTAGQTLLSLINDILDFSKIDSGKMEIVPVEYDISSLIHDLANMASQRIKDKNVRLEVEVDHNIPSRLYGDDVRIRQVLTNILTNAVKYTHEGNVWLRVGGRRTGDTAVLTFEVEDTGIGIREEDLPKLSAEFERIEEDRNHNIEGTGLGMNITIQLLSLMGSRLQIESIYGKGSKFYFKLEQKIVDHTPVGDFESRVHQMTDNYNYSTKFHAPAAKILVVDDNAVNRKVLRSLLKETQIQVTDAEGGAECLELVQKNRYDLIFLDHMMPKMDGVETLHHIKELSGCPCQDTPVVVLTANAVSGAKEKYLSEGFDDFLSKPVVPEKLENMIKKMLPEELLKEAADRSSGTNQTGIGAKKESALENLPEELLQIDGLDWQYAWMHLPDMELLEYTVKEFYAQIDSAADKLERFYGQIVKPEQLEQYRIQVHAMKGLAATVGIMPLSGLAKVLEYAARDGKIDVVTSVTPIFLEEWRSYRRKLQGVFGIEDTAGKEVTDYSVLQALVEMLRLSMKELDIDQADRLVGQLLEYEYPDEIDQNIRRLAEAVTNLEPEETERLAELLIGQMGRQTDA